MKAPEIKSGRKRKGESGKEREGKGEERGGKGEERGGNGERERDKQQWGEKPADGLLPFLLVNCSAGGMFSMVLEIKMLRIRPNPGCAV